MLSLFIYLKTGGVDSVAVLLLAIFVEKWATALDQTALVRTALVRTALVRTALVRTARHRP